MSRKVDQLAKSKLSGLEFQPEEGDWSAMKAVLDERSRHRFIPFWYWAVGALALLSVIGFISFETGLWNPEETELEAQTTIPSENAPTEMIQEPETIEISEVDVRSIRNDLNSSSGQQSFPASERIFSGSIHPNAMGSERLMKGEERAAPGKYSTEEGSSLYLQNPGQQKLTNFMESRVNGFDGRQESLLFLLPPRDLSFLAIDRTRDFPPSEVVLRDVRVQPSPFSDRLIWGVGAELGHQSVGHARIFVDLRYGLSNNFYLGLRPSFGAFAATGGKSEVNIRSYNFGKEERRLEYQLRELFYLDVPLNMQYRYRRHIFSLGVGWSWIQWQRADVLESKISQLENLRNGQPLDHQIVDSRTEYIQPEHSRGMFYNAFYEYRIRYNMTLGVNARYEGQRGETGRNGNWGVGVFMTYQINP